MTQTKKHVVYRIWYGDTLVYVGRTNQPLQTRIRGHLMAKPMHRSIDINQVSLIEYHEFDTEADMNLYEIYLILTLHPPLNVDDKTRDYPTVTLPAIDWQIFKTPLWEKWKQKIQDENSEYDILCRRNREIPEEIAVWRAKHREGVISHEELVEKITYLRDEKFEVQKAMFGK